MSVDFTAPISWPTSPSFYHRGSGMTRALSYIARVCGQTQLSVQQRGR